MTTGGLVVGIGLFLIRNLLNKDASVDVRRMEVKTSSIGNKQLGQFMFQRGSLKQKMLRS